MVLDGTQLRIDRVGMSSGWDRRCYSGKHMCHGVNVQIVSDPMGRLSRAQRVVNAAHAAQHGPGERLSRNGNACD